MPKAKNGSDFKEDDCELLYSMIAMETASWVMPSVILEHHDQRIFMDIEFTAEPFVFY